VKIAQEMAAHGVITAGLKILQKNSMAMQNQPSSHAGGAAKNQKVNQEVILPEGKYTLHYKSDSGHAYNHWDSLPPDDFSGDHPFKNIQ
jgi:hypothetical protein